MKLPRHYHRIYKNAVVAIIRVVKSLISPSATARLRRRTDGSHTTNRRAKIYPTTQLHWGLTLESPDYPSLSASHAPSFFRLRTRNSVVIGAMKR